MLQHLLFMKHLTLFIAAIILFISISKAELALDSCPLSSEEIDQLTHRTTELFYHAYNSYKQFALPHDELLPISCQGTNTFGGVTVSLIDTLDTLILFKDYHEFVSASKYIRDNVSFNINDTVSVFETTIRVLGGLLSAHGLLTEASDVAKFDAWLWYPNYDDALLYLAWDLAERLMPAFDTPTGIPYGAVHLLNGVEANESQIASTAGAGSLLLEFGTLTRLTGDPKYYRVAFKAMYALHKRASANGLVGNHINLINGYWTATEAGVGGLVDSFYEYMLKGYILFGDSRLLNMFVDSYNAIQEHLSHPPWLLDADMWTGSVVSRSYSSLAAFFAGLQALIGEGKAGETTTRAHYAVWRRFGALPEGYDVLRRIVVSGRNNYPLRPELIEAAWYLHQWSEDPIWQGIARNIIAGLEITKQECGLAEIQHVGTGLLSDRQHSFVMSETLKYLYMLLQGINWGNGQFVLTTEAHPLLITSNEIMNIVPEVRDEIGVGKVKCKRRRDVEKQLPCGFSMTGTDHVRFSFQPETETLAGNVVQQVEEAIQQLGTKGLLVGRVFNGENARYKIVKVEDTEIFFQRLDRTTTLLSTQTENCKNRGWRDFFRGKICRKGES